MKKQYENSLTLKEMRKASKQCRKGVNHKNSVMKYDMDCLLRNERLIREISNDTYSISKYISFTIKEPKVREIEATQYRDRVWQRSMVNNGVREFMTKSFIYDNGACQKGKGTEHAICRIIYFLQDYYRKNHTNKGWYTHLDVRKYYPSTPHNVAKRVVKERLGDSEFAYHTCMVVDSCKDKRCDDEINEDVFGKRGILLGSELMQLVQLALPDRIDHAVKEKFLIKYYLRFNDDILIMHSDKNVVAAVADYITSEMKLLGLEVTNKGGIERIQDGIKILKKRFIMTAKGKVLVKVSSEVIGQERRKLKKLKKKLDAGLIDMSSVRKHYNGWSATLNKCDEPRRLKQMDRYYEEIFGEIPERRKKNAYSKSKRANKERKKKSRGTAGTGAKK